MKNKLRKLRQKNGMKQDTLARELNITQGSISEIERGTQMPSVLLALKLARAFGCQVEDIFELERED